MKKLPRKARGKNTHYRMLYKIQNGICAICKKPIFFGKGNIDHIIPKSKGGSNDFINKQLTHYKCNFLKADKLIVFSNSDIKQVKNIFINHEAIKQI